MNVNRLTIAQLQIYFDDNGNPLFSDAMKRDSATIRTALSDYRDFIDRWLDACEDDRPRHITEEERIFRVKLKRSIRDLRKTELYDNDFIKIIIQQAAKAAGDKASTLTAIQIAESIEDAISTL